MSRFIDHTGEIFGKLTVLRRGASTRQASATWICRCACGAEVTVTGGNLRGDRSRSCGPCGIYRTHGQSHGGRDGRATAEYDAWVRMHQRCSNPKHPSWKNYGARGIRVMWDTFEQFFADMGERPSARHSIQRRNKDGHYEKGNCYWALER